MTKQPRGEYACVVDDEQIAPSQMRRQPIERRMLRLPGRAVEDDEPRAAALGRRMLRDQLLGKLEVEVADVHDPKKRPRLVRPRVASRPFHRSPTLAIR